MSLSDAISGLGNSLVNLFNKNIVEASEAAATSASNAAASATAAANSATTATNASDAAITSSNNAIQALRDATLINNSGNADTLSTANAADIIEINEKLAELESEIIDGRDVIDGVTYTNIGGAIREQVNNLKDRITELDDLSLEWQYIDLGKLKMGTWTHIGTKDHEGEQYWRRTELVPCKGNEKLLITGKCIGIAYPVILFFDENENCIIGSGQLNVKDTRYDDELVVTPYNARYFTLTSHNNLVLDWYQSAHFNRPLFAKRLVPKTIIEPEYYDIDFNIAKMYYDLSTGSEISFNAYRSTKKIACKPQDVFKVHTGLHTANQCVAYFWDNEGNYKGYFYRGIELPDSTYDTIPSIDVEIKIPDNVYKVAFAYTNDNRWEDKGKFKVQLLCEKNKDLDNSFMEYVNYGTLRNGWVNTSGVFQSANFGWRTTEMLPCKFTEKLNITASSTTNTPCLFFYDKDGEFLSYFLANNPDDATNMQNHVSVDINVPPYAAYYTVTTFTGESYDKLPIWIFKTSYNQKNIYKDSYWNGKKIVWFGTSIPAGGYPQLVGKKLNAIVFNEAVGSSHMRAGYVEHITNDDPFGWSNSGYLATCFSMSLSRAEKQTLFDNWSYWRERMTGNPPETPTSAFISNSLDCCYDAKLNRYLSGGSVGQCDLYVFDHFHNDAGDSTTDLYYTVPTARSTNERSYAIGAFNFLVRKILEDNPHAKIIISGDYQNDSYADKITECQKKAGDLWGFPVIPLWDKLGISQRTVMTTGEWQNRTWVENATSAHLMTMRAIRIADDVHPGNNNDNQKENNRFADALASEINNIR